MFSCARPCNIVTQCCNFDWQFHRATCKRFRGLLVKPHSMAFSYISRNHETCQSKREQTIALWSCDYLQKDISAILRMSHQTISNINRFVRLGCALPGKPGWKERTVSTPQVVEFVEYCKTSKPRTFTSELLKTVFVRQRIFPRNQQWVHDIWKKDLKFSWKQLSVRPEDSLTQKTLDDIMYMHVWTLELTHLQFTFLTKVQL